MFKAIKVRIAERAANRAIGQALAYNRVPGCEWNCRMQMALNRRADIATHKLAALINA